MADPLRNPPPTSAEDDLAWHVTQDERYEYVDGAPRLMVGATQAHRLQSGNVFALPREGFGPGPGRAVMADGTVVTPKGNYRYPDVAVDCGPCSAKSTILSEPALMVEIWSNSTRWLDLTLKLDDYRSIASIPAILLLSQDRPNGQLWLRGTDWGCAELDGLEAEAIIPPLGLSLPFRALYDGLEAG